MTRLRAFALLILLAVGAFARNSAQVSGIPTDLTSFIDKGRELLKAGDLDGVRKLAESPGTLGWLGQQSRRTRSSWSLDALPMDNAGREFLAVFHEFHTTESTGDHVHKLVHADSGWKFGP